MFVVRIRGKQCVRINVAGSGDTAGHIAIANKGGGSGVDFDIEVAVRDVVPGNTIGNTHLTIVDQEGTALSIGAVVEKNAMIKPGIGKVVVIGNTSNDVASFITNRQFEMIGLLSVEFRIAPAWIVAVFDSKMQRSYVGLAPRL